MGLKRRTFLKIGLGGTALLALGGAGLAMRPTVYVDVPGPLKCLNERQYAILHAVADCVVAPSDAMPSIQSLEVVETIDKMIAPLHPKDVSQILQVLSLLENALSGLLLDGRFQTFTASDRAKRHQILNGWRTSRLSVKQQAFVVLHGLCVSAYWGHPDAYRFTGYSGPPDFKGLVPMEAADG